MGSKKTGNVKCLKIFEKIKKLILDTLVTNGLFSQDIFDSLLSKKEYEIFDFLSSLKIRKTTEEIELLQKNKNAPTEEKKILSVRLNELKIERESKINILECVKDLFDFHHIYARENGRFLKDIMDVLIRSSKGRELELTLDARPNSSLDANPGKVSGDCTEDKPLILGKPDFESVNIKVFKSEKHIGNIYLLNTFWCRDHVWPYRKKSTSWKPKLEDYDASKHANIKRVWHIDAIQIPASFDWENAIKVILNAILEKAKENNISGITINKSPECISNYDYIQEPVLEYAKNNQDPEAEVGYIDIPSINSNYHSGFQYQLTSGIYFIPVK